MSAVDKLDDRTVKKQKCWDATWELRGKVFVLDGKELGELNWEFSRYMKVGKDQCFHAFVGTQYYIVLDTKRVDYVVPKEITGYLPMPGTPDEE